MATPKKYEVGTCVEVKLSGCIEWHGFMDGIFFFGVKLNDRIYPGTNGTFDGKQYFQCEHGYGILVPSRLVVRDFRLTVKEEKKKNPGVPKTKNQKTTKRKSVPQSRPKTKNFVTLERAPIPESVENHRDCEMGTCVEVNLSGYIKWLGAMGNIFCFGVEMNEKIRQGTNGKFDGKQYFECEKGYGIIVPSYLVRQDSRFIDNLNRNEYTRKENRFPCDSEETVFRVCDLREDASWTENQRGIQCEQGSSYLDSTLFVMFAFTTHFDSLLTRPKCPSDITDYEEIQTFIKKAIVNPLRKKKLHFVHSQNVMQLRQYIWNTKTMEGSMSDEKDPEEFLTCLFQKFFKVNNFIDYSDSQGTHVYQIIIPDKFVQDKINPTTQQLFYSSLISSKLLLKKAPNCIIMESPRFGTEYRPFNHVVPSKTIEVSALIKGVYDDISTDDIRYKDRPQMCTTCASSLRTCMCMSCGDSNVFYCDWCWSIHNLRSTKSHTSFPLNIDLQKERSVNLSLFAVLSCFGRNHYVAFIKNKNDWLFFDSMAERVGEENRPEVKKVPTDDVNKWLLQIDDKNVGDMSELERSFLRDSFMFFYEPSIDVNMN